MPDIMFTPENIKDYMKYSLTTLSKTTNLSYFEVIEIIEKDGPFHSGVDICNLVFEQKEDHIYATFKAVSYKNPTSEGIAYSSMEIRKEEPAGLIS